MLDEADTIRTIARQAQDPEAGSLRLGLFPTLAPYLLPHVVPHIHARFPNLELLLVEEKTETVLQQLRAGALDAGDPRPAGARPTRCRSRSSSPRSSCWPCRPTHPLATHEGPVDTSVLATEPVLLLEEGHCLRDQALAVCQPQRGVRARGVPGHQPRDPAPDGRRRRRRHPAARARGAAAGARPPTDIRLLRFAEPVPRRTIALLWRPTSIYRDLLPKLAPVLRDLPPDLVEPAVA